MNDELRTLYADDANVFVSNNGNVRIVFREMVPDKIEVATLIIPMTLALGIAEIITKAKEKLEEAVREAAVNTHN